MNRSWLILASGVVGAVAAYLVFYLVGLGPSLPAGSSPELAWLKKEYQLSDAEYTRVCKLHADYVPQCAEMCRRIDEKNAELQRLLATANEVTPAVEKTLAEAAKLRLECQTMMLRHFFEISRAMPPDQGKRYLAWVQTQTLFPTNRPHLQP